ncbi:uncharacterized protein V6R79_004944 [Siganus canaliculatus]
MLPVSVSHIRKEKCVTDDTSAKALHDVCESSLVNLISVFSSSEPCAFGRRGFGSEYETNPPSPRKRS